MGRAVVELNFEDDADDRFNVASVSGHILTNLTSNGTCLPGKLVAGGAARPGSAAGRAGQAGEKTNHQTSI